jgi:hypothetical protein
VRYCGPPLGGGQGFETIVEWSVPRCAHTENWCGRSRLGDMTIQRSSRTLGPHLEVGGGQGFETIVEWSCRQVETDHTSFQCVHIAGLETRASVVLVIVVTSGSVMTVHIAKLGRFAGGFL